MVINWYGEGCFKIQTGGLTILTDPFDTKTGLTPARFKADIEIHTITPIEARHTDKESGGLIAGPGEYEIKGVHVYGWPLTATQAEIKSAYIVKAEDMMLVFLGSLDTVPSANLLEHAGVPDILFVPVGGNPHLDGAGAAKVVKQLSPKIVIPAFFKISGLTRKADTATPFLKELGKEASPEEKLVIKKKELPASTKVVLLSL